MRGLGGFLLQALFTTVLVLATIFVLNRFTLTKGIVQTALAG